MWRFNHAIYSSRLIYIHTRAQTRVRTYSHIHTHPHACTHTSTRIHAHIHTHAHTSTRMHTRIHTHAHTRIHTYDLTHTSTPTHAQAFLIGAGRLSYFSYADWQHDCWTLAGLRWWPEFDHPLGEPTSPPNTRVPGKRWKYWRNFSSGTTVYVDVATHIAEIRWGHKMATDADKS